MFVPNCYEDYKVCNCANCSKLLAGESMFDWIDTLPVGRQVMGRVPPRVYKRINHRPYCKSCVEEFRRVNEEQKKYVRS